MSENKMDVIPAKHPTNSANKKERGSVLFIILLAVALFAALSYAVTSSTRSTGGDASKETNALNAAQMVQYTSVLDNQLMRMRISNNCDPSQISFENSLAYVSSVSNYTNPSAPSNKTCHLFDPAGGNA